MKKDMPMWAMRMASPEDHVLVQDAYRHGRVQIKWPSHQVLRDWAKQQAWPTPWFGFEDAFLHRMLENRGSFELAINESGIEIHIPQQEVTISGEMLRELDALYEDRSINGRPTGWGMLVEELREIRRAVEAGVVVKVEGTKAIQSWQSFYEWAHGRYHMLEDGYDHWIGDDNS